MHVAKETFEFSTSQSKDWSSTEWSEGPMGHFPESGNKQRDLSKR